MSIMFLSCHNIGNCSAANLNNSFIGVLCRKSLIYLCLFVLVLCSASVCAGVIGFIKVSARYSETLSSVVKINLLSADLSIVPLSSAHNRPYIAAYIPLSEAVVLAAFWFLSI